MAKSIDTKMIYWDFNLFVAFSKFAVYCFCNCVLPSIVLRSGFLLGLVPVMDNMQPTKQAAVHLQNEGSHLPDWVPSVLCFMGVQGFVVACTTRRVACGRPPHSDGGVAELHLSARQIGQVPQWPSLLLFGFLGHATFPRERPAPSKGEHHGTPR